MTDPISTINAQHPSVLPYLMLASMLLSMMAPLIVKRWPRTAVPIDWILHILSALPGRVQATQLAAKRAATPPKMPGASLPPLALLLLALGVVGCTKTKGMETKVALDVGQAVCAEVGPRTSSEYVDVVCSAIDVADGVAHTFTARVWRIDAVALGVKPTCATEVKP